MFTTFLLADEINRAPAKTQSALLQAMQERRVTIDRETHALSPNFTVFATQNPVEYEGTYPLPEAQKDRFMLKVSMDPPDRENELELARRMLGQHSPEETLAAGRYAVISADDLGRLRRSRTMTVREESSPMLADARDAHDTVLRRRPARQAPTYSRASNAALNGRDFVSDDCDDHSCWGTAQPAWNMRSKG